MSVENIDPIGKQAGNRQPSSDDEQNRGKLDRQTSRMTEKAKRCFFAREGVDPLTSAFARKSTVHAGIGGTPVDNALTLKTWDKIMNQPRTASSTAYFHIPFCRNRCLYCGFYKYSADRAASREYTDALISELHMDRNKPAVSGYPLHAVYLGGGTPTVLAPKDLERLLTAISRFLPLANDCEITIETTAADLDEDTLSACIAGGANRFSVGVQSFDTAVRKNLGRRSDREKVIKCLQRARDKNAAAIIIDLIYGLPGQNMTIWENDIETFLDLEIDGADFYQLNVFNNTPLAASVETGRLPKPAGLAEQAHMFKRGVELMEAWHCRRLSMTHWATGSRERNMYNQLMKSGSPCLPYGSGAGGTLGGYLCMVNNDLEAYFKKVAAGCKPISAMLEEPPHKPLINAIAGGLETGYLNMEKIREKYEVDLCAICAPLLDQWWKTGLIHREGGRISLTLPGQFWQVNLAQALIDYYNEFTQ
ncbi:MAG: heme anaerobic degradation radical SAM methyltransferase ChuW/HutW [Desulfobacterales bacterium]